MQGMVERKNVVLKPEMIPVSMWGVSAYRLLRQRAPWTKRIRPDALAQANNCCSFSGASGGRLVCHDKWKFDDRRAVATLIGFEIHCGDCDAATHPGLSMSIYPRDYTEKLILAQLSKVNGCTKREARGILADAAELWRERSKKTWKVKVASALVKKYPELSALPTFNPLPIAFVIGKCLRGIEHDEAHLRELRRRTGIRHKGCAEPTWVMVWCRNSGIRRTVCRVASSAFPRVSIG